MSTNGITIIILAGLITAAMFPVKWFVKNALIACAAAAFVVTLGAFFSANDYKFLSFIAVIDSASSD